MNDREASAMLQTMARMQEAHNQQVHPDWRVQQYPYYRAVWVECAELLDHFGWKWWKHQQPDAGQVKLELVDIWHFGLSDLMRAEALSDTVAADLAAVSDRAQPDDERFRLAVEALAQQTLSDRLFAMAPFLAVLESLPLPLPELFRLYVGKNVLNHFRQDHGYKAGTYRKTWQGREDNDHLIELLDDLDAAPEDVPDRLYEALAQRYGAHP
ncbi:MAG: dUTP diphosphatase [Gammaproteobacteria bacterium]|nr:dUTP diphosphatase [Gammaproteobacteria bacterium]